MHENLFFFQIKITFIENNYRYVEDDFFWKRRWTCFYNLYILIKIRTIIVSDLLIIE